MKKIKETEKNILFEEIKSGQKSIYRLDKTASSKKKELVYVQKDDKIVYQFPSGKSIKQIILQGFEELPVFLSEYGFGFKEYSLNAFFRYKFDDDRINQLKIEESTKSRQKGKSIILNLEELEQLFSAIRKEKRASSDSKKILIQNLIVNAFPEAKFDHNQTNNNKELILRNLNDKLIDKLTSRDIEEIGNFYVSASRKFKATHIVKKLSAGMLKNAQLITLQNVIRNYEQLLKDDPAESSWQKFFDEHITLFDSRYVHKLDYKNIAVGVTKYPDLVLVDIYGYLDFYELKKSSTKLLQYDSSHKTWYWSKDVSMVISQVTEYLQKAKENAESYSKTIKNATETETEQGIEVDIINPRAIIVIGSRKELNTKIKKDQFKSLRESLKDIEFILYDELLDRLKNWFDSIKIK